MRRWPSTLALSLLAACYSPSAAPGAPCTPALANCPDPQVCALVGADYQCVTTIPIDGAIVPIVDGPATPGDTLAIDAPGTVVDAPGTVVDAPGPVVDARQLDAALPIDAAALPDAPLPKWTLVQTAGAMNTRVHVATTGTGNLIVVAIQTGGSGMVTGVTDDGGNVYTAIPAAHAFVAGEDLALEIWYAQASQPGATQISVAGSLIYGQVAWEVAGIRTSGALDTAAALSSQPDTLTPTGPTLVTAAAGEFVVAAGVLEHANTGIHAGNEFTNDRLVNGNGWAHLTDAAAAAGPHQAEWDQNPIGVYCAGTAAFRVGP